MKEEDIDKIFREALAEQKVATTESDWNAFEAMLNSRKSGLLKWSALIGIIFLIGGSVAAYYFISDQHKTAFSIDRSNLNQTGKPPTKVNSALLNRSDSTQSETTNEHAQEHSVNPDENTQTPAGNSKNADLLAGSAELSEKNQDTKPGESKRNMPEPEVKSGRSANTGVLKEHKPISKKYEEHNVPMAAQQSMASNSAGRSADNPALDNMNSIVKDASSQNSAPGYHANDKLIGLDQLQINNPRIMPMKEAGIDADITAGLKDEKRKVEPIRNRDFIPFIYFKLEQNSVFNTTPAIGLGVQKYFSMQGIGTFSVSGAIGYQRTGRLAWVQSSQNVIYGFDRYVEESTLLTRNLSMIQVPIRLSYHRGLHRVFLGANLNWVVNASQEFTQLSEGTTVEGYFYDSNAPKSALFFDIGYGFTLNEKILLNLGINAALSDWPPADERPLGAFIQINYKLR